MLWSGRTNMPRRLVIGSRNAKKVREMRALIRPPWAASPLPEDWEIVGLEDFPNAPEPEETGATFEENARIKAVEFARALGEWVLADDSGLTVDALDGAPGVLSARYAGAHGDDDANNAKLLDALREVPQDRRGAAFVCRLAISDPTGEVRLESGGSCRGRIVDHVTGVGGFGYDPLFLIPEYHKTFGELPAIVKHQLSHRCRAFEHLRAALNSYPIPD